MRHFHNRWIRSLVVVDGATPELADSAAKTLATALASKPEHIEAVYEPEAGQFFESNGLLFLSVDEVRHTTEQLIRAQPFLGTLAADPTLRGLAQALAFIPKGVQEGAIAFKDFATPLARFPPRSMRCSKGAKPHSHGTS